MVTAEQEKIALLEARGKWTHGVRTEVSVRSFSPFVMDEPQSLGGDDTGPNPMEYVLGSYIGCASVMLNIIAKEYGLTYSGAEFHIEGTLDIRGLEGAPDISPYFNKVFGTVRVTTNASDEALQRVVSQVEKRCPVYTMLVAAGVETDIQWIGVSS